MTQTRAHHIPNETSDPEGLPVTAPRSPADWSRALAPFCRPDNRQALAQLIVTLGLLAAGLLTMAWLDAQGLVLSWLLALPMAGLWIRIFIFQHDAGHGSFFSSRRWNRRLGHALGILTLTPFDYWRRTHAIHHADNGNLAGRDLGDITTLTVDEYLSLPRHRRLAYRLYRHPLVFLVLGPIYQFVIKHRFPFDAPFSWRQEWRSVGLNNLALAVILLLAAWLDLLLPMLKLYGPVFFFGSSIGIWLFYVQHQFEQTYWQAGDRWSLHEAALRGSSFYDLPAFLHWWTGNIGYHHVHHLSSRIPNYHLADCHRAFKALQRAPRLTLRSSLACARLKLWDPRRQRLVAFDDLI